MLTDLRAFPSPDYSAYIEQLQKSLNCMHSACMPGACYCHDARLVMPSYMIRACDNVSNEHDPQEWDLMTNRRTQPAASLSS